MGMSASQARLLSITTRLTNNEFRSQMTANAKIRLANQTQAASEKYMEALDSTKMVYSYYDANGSKSQETLTANVLTFYQPLKNQYGLINNAGQIMVNSPDATTFTQAKNRDEFLVLNKCAQMVEKEVLDEDWYKDWKKREPKVEDFTRDEKVPTESNELYDEFMRQADVCYRNATKGLNCYMHVLASMIGSDQPHTTSDGNTFTVTRSGSWEWNYDGHPMPTVVAGVKDAMCCSQNGCPNAGKTVYQAAVDLLWKAHHTYNTEGNQQSTGGDADTPEEQQYLQEFFHLIDHDLKQSGTEIVSVFYEDEYNTAVKEWKNEEPQMKTVSELEITDPDKAEWYTNLWYRMNGALFDETFMEDPTDPDYNTFEEKYFDKAKEHDQSWVVLEDSLLNSPEWLQYALEAGVVTLEQVKFQEKTETSTELKNHEWTTVSWSSTSDISEIDDDLAVTKAEVEYNTTLAKIQSDDKQLDNDIKKLDTEHNALQTEYDSIKGVMDKNMERSFKAFS